MLISGFDIETHRGKMELMSNKKRPISVAKAVLSVLWTKERADTRLLLNHRYLYQLCAKHNKGTLRSSLTRLTKAGLIEKGGGVYTLSIKGQKRAKTAFIEAELALHQPETKWDGGWRIILFDVPESKRKHRDQLRSIIRQIGFREFQKSIWVYPYPVPSFMKDFLLDPNVKQYARFITTEAIENDADLRALFKI